MSRPRRPRRPNACRDEGMMTPEQVDEIESLCRPGRDAMRVVERARFGLVADLVRHIRATEARAKELEYALKVARMVADVRVDLEKARVKALEHYGTAADCVTCPACGEGFVPEPKEPPK
jgi:hypothetical protein